MSKRYQRSAADLPAFSAQCRQCGEVKRIEDMAALKTPHRKPGGKTRNLCRVCLSKQRHDKKAKRKVA